MSRIVWITGLPASGKTSVAKALVAMLRERGHEATLVDSDETREAITPKPTYDPAERALVYRAMAYLAKRLDEAGTIPVVAATAHARELRDEVREVAGGLFLVHASAPLAVCEARDPKGLYQRARVQEEGAMPGVHVRYEAPSDADLEVDTGGDDAARAARNVLDALVRRGALGS